MEWQGCWATKSHVVGEVVVAKEAEFTTAKKKKKIMMAYKILGGRLIVYQLWTRLFPPLGHEIHLYL
jgi:hypothetical protein